MGHPGRDAPSAPGPHRAGGVHPADLPLHAAAPPDVRLAARGGGAVEWLGTVALFVGSGLAFRLAGYAQPSRLPRVEAAGAPGARARPLLRRRGGDLLG